MGVLKGNQGRNYDNYNREGNYVRDGNYNRDKTNNRNNYGNKNERVGPMFHRVIEMLVDAPAVSIKQLEQQFSQLSTIVNPRQPVTLPRNTIQNPKNDGHCMIVTTHRGKLTIDPPMPSEIERVILILVFDMLFYFFFELRDSKTARIVHYSTQVEQGTPSSKQASPITYHDKATQTETEEEDTIEKILKAITTLCTKVDSMDNEIQKLKTDEDNLKSKASQQHDYKNAELCRSEDGKNPELKGDDGKLLKTHNVCLYTAADISDNMAKQEAKHTGNREKTSILCHPNVETGRRGKPFRGVNKVEALIRRKYPLKYGASSDRKT
ncbi:hypothetical protein MTR67_026636 [Solanum verrucosum]|uniref:Integrase core domain containing protein n=1 Tax=Solanum verrucosum TaxID=315347 RepID=A0AAF0R7L8_SOLVR|nr:hypothetical protein MTR67_026636 [Solanum verrucosum]